MDDQERDLFGAIVQKGEVSKEFTNDEVDAIINDAPKALLGELADCLSAVRKGRTQKDPHRMTEAKKRLWLNIEWVFELSETSAVLPFDVACAFEGVNPEHIRSRMSCHFAAEIREFFSAYASAQPLDAGRVAKKLHLYISLGH